MLHLDQIEVTYPGGIKALRPVNLNISKGDFVVLLGPSGAGKSTLLRAINHLVTPTGGEITVDGIGQVDSSKKLREHRRKSAMVFQQHQLIGRLSALQNTLTGRLSYYSAWRTLIPLPDEDKMIAFQALERVGLVDQALRRADQMSGGQQQRVGIARALAQQPVLMLADEPVASLDPQTSRKVLGLLHDICRSDKIAVIVSLHQVELAREFADRVVGIANGHIVFDGLAAGLSEAVLAQIYGSKTPTQIDSAETGAPELHPADAHAVA